MSDDQVKLVKDANDIVQVIGEYLNLTRAGRTFRGLCPFHDDHRPSFQVDPVRQTFKCWPCDVGGDVITFVMKRERLDFMESLELLARRAGITLKKSDPTKTQSRQKMLDVMGWASDEYHKLLFQNPKQLAYISDDRQLAPETIESYKLGYAPDSWEWLANRASAVGKPIDILCQVGLCAQRQDGSPYDRFRDRIIFPIRDVRGNVVGLGGRILPGSPQAADQPKYYNSSDTPLFTKSHHLYGIDVARPIAEKLGYLAVVEGYTDVLMAHQFGVLPVVATLGTALNARHIAQLKRYVPRVVLLYDADAGGMGGVQRALSLFVEHEMELAIASLPKGMDPCDFLLAQGAAPFHERIKQATDALEFTLDHAFQTHPDSVEGRRLAIDQVLTVLAQMPVMTRENLSVKRELMMNRLAKRSGVEEATLRRRLDELRKQVERQAPRDQVAEGEPKEETTRAVVTQPTAPIDRNLDKLERELIQALLVDPSLVQEIQELVSPQMLSTPRRQRVLTELYLLLEDGLLPDVNALRGRLVDDPELINIVSRIHADGLEKTNPKTWFAQILTAYRKKQSEQQAGQIREQIRTWKGSEPPLELLRQLQALEAETRQKK